MKTVISNKTFSIVHSKSRSFPKFYSTNPRTSDTHVCIHWMNSPEGLEGELIYGTLDSINEIKTKLVDQYEAAKAKEKRGDSYEKFISMQGYTPSFGRVRTIDAVDELKEEIREKEERY